MKLNRSRRLIYSLVHAGHTPDFVQPAELHAVGRIILLAGASGILLLLPSI
jgi:hypothetical protein